MFDIPVIILLIVSCDVVLRDLKTFMQKENELFPTTFAPVAIFHLSKFVKSTSLSFAFRHGRLEGRCAADETFIEVVTNGESNFVEFGLSAFVWTRNLSASIYTHCEALVCHNSSGECSAPICPAARKRRSSERKIRKVVSFPKLDLYRSPCEENNPCKHLCALMDGAAKCFCMQGFVLADDGLSCNPVRSRNKVVWASEPEPRSNRLLWLGFGFFSCFVLMLFALALLYTRNQQIQATKKVQIKATPVSEEKAGVI